MLNLTAGFSSNGSAAAWRQPARCRRPRPRSSSAAPESAGNRRKSPTRGEGERDVESSHLRPAGPRRHAPSRRRPSFGCQTFGSDGVTSSSAPAELPASAAPAVAGDLVPRLVEQIGRGTATIVLKPDSSTLGSALETSLRTWGYAVTSDQDAKKYARAIGLAYVLAPVDEQVLAGCRRELSRSAAST